METLSIIKTWNNNYLIMNSDEAVSVSFENENIINLEKFGISMSKDTEGTVCITIKENNE